MSGWSSFLEVEPLMGRRHVEASEQRTRQDWARGIRSMLTERYPQTERVVLVLDNLNTHGIESLYASYPPEQAQALAERLEIHYTPKHGNWFNISEIELSALGGQCLDQWIGGCPTLPPCVIRCASGSSIGTIGRSPSISSSPLEMLASS